MLLANKSSTPPILRIQYGQYTVTNPESKCLIKPLWSTLKGYYLEKFLTRSKRKKL